MSRNYVGLGVSLPHNLVADLEGFAARKGCSRAEAIRVSISTGLPLLNAGLAINARRTIAILEHTQLALSLMIERESPEDAAELLKLAFRNVDAHHS